MYPVDNERKFSFNLKEISDNSAAKQPVLLSSLILDRPALGFKTLNVNIGKSAAVGNVIQGQQKQLCFLLIHTLSTLFDLNVCRSALWWDATMVPGLGIEVASVIELSEASGQVAAGLFM